MSNEPKNNPQDRKVIDDYLDGEELLDDDFDQSDVDLFDLDIPLPSRFKHSD